MKETFGINPTQHKKLKGLKHHNLRDHMTGIELIFMRLGEEAAGDFIEKYDVQKYEDHKNAAHKGGTVAHEALQVYEVQTGKKVLNPANFLPENRDKYL